MSGDRKRSAARWLVATLVAGITASGQTAFEVASIKPSAVDRDKAYVQAIPGRLLMVNFAPRTLITLAFGVEGYQLSGGPSWIESERYDIQAKAEGNASVQQMEGPMLQALLAERFQLKFHREMKQMSVYELSVAGRGNLKVSEEGSCIPYDVNAPPPLAPKPGEPRPNFCGYPRSGGQSPNRTLDGGGISIPALAKALERGELHRPVIDRTGLQGAFDLHLRWASDSAGGQPDPDAADSVSIFAAVKEQLGLKLESSRGAVEVIVIDRMERPSPN